MFTFSGDKQLRFGVTIFPAVEKVRSALADVTEIHKYFLAKVVNAGNLSVRVFHHSK